MFKKILKIAYPYFFLLAVLSVTLIATLSSGDEIWNYNFARNILSGRLPYVDFNMIQTPLSAYIAAGFLGIFGESLFVFRILGIILGLLVFGLLFYICKKITGHSFLPFIVSCCYASIFLIVWMYNYNHLNLLVILIIMLMEINKDKNSYSTGTHSVVLGVLYGLTPLIKQSTGAFLFLLNIGLSIWSISKKSKKTNHIIQLFSSFIPGIMFLVFLLCTNSFNGFWNYAVMGVSTFTNHNSYFNYIISNPFSFCIGVFPVLSIGGKG